MNHNKSQLVVALVQMNIDWLMPKSNLKKIEHMLEGVTADLIVLPETFLSGFAFAESRCGESIEGESFGFMQSLAEKYQAAVVGSVATLAKGKKVNRCYFVKPDGTHEYYDKRHLFRMAGEDQHVVAGKQRKVVEYLGWNILLQVCYDLRFPVWSRNKNDYDLMINVANWPAARRKPWDTLLRARAIENLAYVVGVNRVGADGNNIEHSGGTAIIDFAGNDVVTATDGRQHVIQSTIDKTELNRFREKFPAHLDSDEFTIIS